MEEFEIEFKELDQFEIEDVREVVVQEVPTFPTLENLSITPTTEEQVFNHEDSYGYDEVRVEAVQGKSLEVTPSNEEQSFSDLYTNVKVLGDDDLLASNIKQGVEIFGVTGSLEEMTTETKEGINNQEEIITNQETTLEEINQVIQDKILVKEKYKPRYMSQPIKFQVYTGTELDHEVSMLDTTYFTDMSYMFYSCGALKKINLSSFNTSNVENMLHMFNSCGNLTELNLSSFNTSKVTNMSNMFYNCAILNKLNISSFDTSNVTDMKYMFGCCKFLTSLDLRHFRTDKVTSMYYMFTTCTKLTTLYLNNFNTIELEEMNGMFSECYALIDYYIPLTFGPKDIRHGDFADTSSIKYFYIKSELDSVSLITKIKVLINDLPKCSGETGILDTSFLNLSLATALKNDRITASLATAKNWKFK